MFEPRANVTVANLPRFRRQLLVWFARTKRDLDWRRTRDPYHIWVSEIMLQQTRVATVVPYYRRFLARFPTADSLARARIDAVLKCWAGLGYYSRARNLHRAAKQIAGGHGGKFPSTPADALALPGVGHYTAAAVLSIAYGHPLAVLDGNVARVLARLGAVRGELRRPQIWRHLAAAADHLLDGDAPGDWNQAIMELGATICTPRSPRCAECPVARWCRARALGVVGEVPAARRKAKTVHITLAAAVLLDPQGRTFLVRERGNGRGALFSRLWQFPAVEASRDARSRLTQYLASIGLPGAQFQALATARHTVTFRALTLLPFLVRVERLPVASGSRRPQLAALDHLPVSSATRKIATAALGAIRKP